MARAGVRRGAEGDGEENYRAGSCGGWSANGSDCGKEEAPVAVVMATEREEREQGRLQRPSWVGEDGHSDRFRRLRQGDRLVLSNEGGWEDAGRQHLWQDSATVERGKKRTPDWRSEGPGLEKQGNGGEAEQAASSLERRRHRRRLVIKNGDA